MKALILVCNAGRGHTSVSLAIAEALAERGVDSEIFDALSVFSKHISQLFSKGHTELYRHHPHFSNMSYTYAEKHPMDVRSRAAVRKMLHIGAERLYSHVQEGGFDCLICPHVISALMADELIRLHPNEIKSSCFVATDYTCSPLADKTGLDWYFVPTQDVAEEFAAAGVPSEKTVVTGGIPVQNVFYTEVSKAEAKAALGLSPDCRHLLVMSGSMGCGHIERVVALVAKNMRADEAVTVVCGTNEHLRQRLEQDYAGREQIRILGFTDNVAQLMDSADLLLTKPGGLTTSEAQVRQLPMVLVDVVSSCEKYNLRHYCSLGGAVWSNSEREAARYSLALLRDKTLLGGMSERLRLSVRPEQVLCGTVISGSKTV